MYKLSFFIVLFALAFTACNAPESTPETKSAAVTEENPPADGFDAANSDEKAIALADLVMKAMGGRPAWDSTRFIEWDFFGARKLYWDKQTGRVRIHSEKDDYTVLMNINDMKGKVRKGGEEFSHPDSLSKYLQMGKEVWINDSYWLVMPFKLKDSGVRLTYAREDTTQTGQKADVLDLQFKNVGVTPNNRYEVYVDQEDHLVTQWNFFTNATDSMPRFSTPWDGYKQHGKIMLSSGRGNYQLSEIAVRESMADAAFESFDWTE